MRYAAALPILKNHNAQEPPIGQFLVAVDGSMYIDLEPGFELTTEQFFANFGNIGGDLIESVMVDGEKRIRSFKIREFSVT